MGAWLLMSLLAAAQLVDVATLEPRWRLDVKYATPDNFTGRRLYSVARCLLRPEVAHMLVRAQRYLDEHAPGHVFVLKDCYRPRHVQELMWSAVAGTPQEGYVADPRSTTGSVHNYGAAVDLTLAHGQGGELDMGTPFDSFQPLSQPRHEERFLREGKLTKAQARNRRLLRDAMTQGGGFLSIPNEWWHFDALRGAALRRRYGILDVPLDAVLTGAGTAGAP